MNGDPPREPPWGLLAEFATAEALLAATQAARAAGYQRLQAYSPHPVEGLAEAVGFTSTRLPAITFVAALVGGLGGYLLQWYSAVKDYPLNVGGRPAHSWPMFVPVSFELLVLCGALAAFASVIIGNRLPDLWSPVFEAPEFDLASRNRFFLCLRTDAPGADPAGAQAWLLSQQALACTVLWP